MQIFQVVQGEEMSGLGSKMLKAIGKFFLYILRSIVSVFATFFWAMECFADSFAGISARTEYKREGACKRCGDCCRALAIYVPGCLRKFGKWISRWHRLAYDFKLIGVEDGWHIYECNHLGNDGRCRIYPFRFRICRDYPRARLFGRTLVHRSCGFYFSRRDGRPDFEEELKKTWNRDLKAR